MAEIKQIESAIESAKKNRGRHVEELEYSTRAMPSGGLRRPMTEHERKWVSELQTVRTGFQSKDRPFILSMATFPDITDKQGAYIKVLIYKYRRQL